MKQVTAQLISLVFHPLIFALLIPFIVMYRNTGDMIYGLKWTAFSFLFVFCAVGVLFILRPRELLRDFDISKREKRPLFYATSLFFAVVYFCIAVYLKSIFFPLSLVALGMIIGLVVFDLVNMSIKVSIHAAVVWAFVITFGVFYGITGFLSVIWIPFVVIWSRLVLKKHTKAEVIGGSAIGSLVTLITFAIAKLIL